MQLMFHRTRNTCCGTWYLPHINCTTTKLFLTRVILRLYCACAKRPYFHSRSKIWHHHRVPRPRFPIGRGNFGDSAINKGYIAYFLLRMRWVKRPYFRFRFEDVFSLFFIGKAKSPPYYCFRVVWPTDLESMLRVEPPTLIISAMFEVDTNIHRRVIAMLVRLRHVTLSPWPLTF